MISSTSKQSNGKCSWPEVHSIKQYFSLPDSIIYYITNNPSSAETCSKLIQSCKYFFEKNPILIVNNFHNNGKKICSNDERECYHKYQNSCCIKVDLQKVKSKIWLTKQLQIIKPNVPNIVSVIPPKLYQCGNAKFTLWCCTIQLNDFLIFASKFQNFWIGCVKFIDGDGNNVMLEKIIESVPYAKIFDYSFSSAIPAANASTMKNILKLKNLDNLQLFRLCYIPESIIVADLAEFIKKNKNTKFRFGFISNISDEYKSQLDELIDEIIKSEIPNRFICYSGQDKEKRKIMFNRFNGYFW